MNMVNKLRLSLGRAVVKLISDSTKLQSVQLQLLEGEVRADAERFQNYGFTSVPKAGAEAVVMFLGGDRSHPVVVAVDDRRYRKRNMQPGEVCIYTDEDDYIHIKRNGNIEIKCTTQVNIKCPSVNMEGNLNVEGSITCDNNITDDTSSMNQMRAIYNGHTNPSNGTAVPPQQM